MKQNGGKRKTYGGRPVRRDTDGFTPRERLDHVRALQVHQEYLVRKGQLVEIERVRAGHAEMQEVIRADLLGTLVQRLVAEFADKPTMSAQGVREVALNVVRELLSSWHKAGAVEDSDAILAKQV